MKNVPHKVLNIINSIWVKLISLMIHLKCDIYNNISYLSVLMLIGDGIYQFNIDNTKDGNINSNIKIQITTAKCHA